MIACTWDGLVGCAIVMRDLYVGYYNHTISSLATKCAWRRLHAWEILGGPCELTVATLVINQMGVQ